MSDNAIQQKAKLMVFAPERLGLPAPYPRIDSRNHAVTFEPLNSKRRFYEYDGVIVFQRTFEDLKRVTTDFSSFWSHSWFQDELDRRTKETVLLLEKGGFVCFILCYPLVDRGERNSFETTDLVKRYLVAPHFYREDFARRTVHVDSVLSEFQRFFDLYGAANSLFKWYNKDLPLRRLAVVGQHVVGMVLDNQVFFVPSLIPQWTETAAEEYFDLLVDAIISTTRKLQVEVPEWARQVQFEEEATLLAKRAELESGIASISERLKCIDQMKRVLVGDGPALVEDVANLLRRELGLSVETIEEFREDIKIQGPEGQPIVLCEIKGTNRSVKREHVNQADSHRDRAHLGPDFPTLLIVNTHVKNARSLEEKDQPLAAEQVRHAARNRVLLLRTLDLLHLTRLNAAGRITREQILELFLNQSGWLKVDGEKWTVLRSGDE